MRTDHGMDADRVWPFLVARGRRVGYRAILVPDAMTGTSDEDVLADSVHASVPSSDGARVDRVATSTMGDLTMVYRVHRLQPADVERRAASTDDAGAADGSPAAATDIHGRPIDLFYGFVTPANVRRVESTDLRVARDAGLSAYRRFLTDEQHYASEGAQSFQPHSVVTPVAARRAPGSGAQRSPSPQVPSGPRPRVDEPPARTGSSLRALDVIGLAGVLIVLVVVVVALALPSQAGPEVTGNVCVPTSSGGSHCTVELAWTGDPPLRITATEVVVDQGADAVEWTVDDDCPTGRGELCQLEIVFDGPLPSDAPAPRLMVRHNVGDPIDVPLEIP